MGGLNLKLMKGIEEAEGLIKKDKSQQAGFRIRRRKFQNLHPNPRHLPKRRGRK